MKKRLIAIFMALAMTLGLSGCSTSQNAEKVKLSIYLWDKSMCKEFTPWLEKEFPDIEFTFVVGYNTIDFYTDLSSRNALPDIITCRRFSLNDAAHLSEQLMDLSQSEVVGSFYDSYIENNRETSGAIRWLPMCAEVDGYIANVDLFKKCGIEIPTNYAEFADACKRFEELGLFGYANDYREDYSCMEALQGCAIPELMGVDGTMWRMQYESETDSEPVGLDEKVWKPVFRKFEQYIKDTGPKPENLEMTFSEIAGLFADEKVAIMRGTASDCTNLRNLNNLNCVMLPYFGENSEDNWLLTYPTYQVAVNKKVNDDSKKSDAVKEVLERMFSEEGQRKAATTSAVLSYNKNVNLEIGDAFSMVQDCVNRNHLYIRLASTEMFSVSKNVVQKMICGEYGADGAYEDFNAQLLTVKETSQPEVVTTLETTYDYAAGKHGSPAASVLVNTVRKQNNSDIAIGYSSIITSPLFAGDYTEQQLRWFVANRVIVREGELSGAEIKQLLDWLVNVKEDGKSPIRHKNLMPVTSGIEYTVNDNGDGTYKLGEITVNGTALDESAVYRVMTLGDKNFIVAEHLCGCPMPEELDEKLQVSDVNAAALLIEALKNGNGLEAPTDYVTVK